MIQIHLPLRPVTLSRSCWQKEGQSGPSTSALDRESICYKRDTSIREPNK